MAYGKVPGAIGQDFDPVSVEDGTMCRQVSGRPGSIGADTTGVESWPMQKKLLEAARLTTPLLPVEMREQFLALFTRKNLEIMGAVFAIWGASQYFGAGEVIDIGLLIFGWAMIGWQVFEGGRELGEFVMVARGARSEADLQTAAVHLARAVVTLGIATFSALILKYGKRLKSITVEEYWGLDLDAWLARLGKPKAPPLVRARLELALDFYGENYSKKPIAKITEYLGGIDFSKDVVVTPLPADFELIAYGDPENLGMWYTKAGTYLDRLGISKGARQFMLLKVNKPIRVLESRAADINDWSEKVSNVPRASNRGGGVQYIVPDPKGSLTIIREGEK